jgi:hypothetical protein
VDAIFSRNGPGFKQIAVAWAANVAGDTLITIGLAGTLFFDVPSTEARDKVALYLLLTLAPFTVVAPLLGGIFARFRNIYRAMMVLSAAARVVGAVLLTIGLNTFWLFPAAFGMLVLARLFGISKSAMLPIALPEPVALVAANARLARIGIYAGAVAVPLAAGLAWMHPAVSLLVSIVFFGFAAYTCLGLPDPKAAAQADAAAAAARGISPETGTAGPKDHQALRRMRLSRLATAGVRLLNGFLLALLAFEFKDSGGALDFGALIGAAGLGFGLASFLSPWLERKLREEPMVVAGLAIEAAAAFIAGEFFGLPAAAALAGAAGLAWGTAKFAFDGMLQNVVHPDRRGAAFVRSETLFQLAWVVGALLPVAISIDAEVGLAVAGVFALAAQTVFVSGLLVGDR